MAELGRGIKAGLVAGLIASLLMGIVTLGLNLTIFHDDIANIIDQSMAKAEEQSGQPISQQYSDTALMFAVYGSPVFSIVFGLIFGGIIGLIFGWLYNRIPGKTPIAKGIVVGITWWVIGIAIGFVIQSLTGSTESVSMSETYMAVSYTTSLIGQLIYGYLLGKFWIRFGG